MFKKFFILISLVAGLSASAWSQELFCNVNIDWSSVQLNPADKDLLNNFKTAVTNFMNTRRWTNDQYNPEERIKCNLYIIINKIPSFGSFEATASIQSSRPVYMSSYESTLLNFLDKKFIFDYQQNTQMDFNENTFFNNLTAMLGFYAYVILGLDYDSFSKMGGNPYFEKARNVAYMAQASSGQDSWSPNESTINRYWLMENITNQQFLPMREGFYTYHRFAMDKFIENPEQSRKDIMEVLKKIRQVQMYNPASIWIRTFFIGKMNELINIYSGASSDMKKQAVELLSQLDPVNADKYNTKILK